MKSSADIHNFFDSPTASCRTNTPVPTSDAPTSLSVPNVSVETSETSPSAPLIEELSRGNWHKISESLGFSTDLSAKIPCDALAVWGIDPADAAVFGGIQVLAAAPQYRLIQVDDPTGHAGFDALRKLIMSVRRLNPEQCVVWWWTRPKTLTIATLDEHIDGRVFVRRMDIERHQPNPNSLAQLTALNIRQLANQDMVDPGRALRRHLGEVLSQQPLTRAFFAGFTRALATLTAAMADGPGDLHARHDIALATLLRLVFLYFLQIRGALNHDRRFVLRHLRAARADQRNFYRTTLRPLFFGALNKPDDARDARARALGELPFLNGGLFEPLPAETQHPALTWPDAVWREVIEELLEHYQFTVEEMQGADEQRAVDPEMLGRVFEGLMFGQTRQHSGSFYTPRDVVRKLVDEAMTGFLSDKTDLTDAQIHAMLAGESVALAEDARARLLQALDEVKILDPAVGTGAFLLEALQVLRRLRRYATPAAGDSGAPADPLHEYRAVRALIHDHLFGVDIQHTAVRLCELRLWLALLTTLPDIAIDQMPPLPNLSHRVCAGNSLLAPDDLLNLRGEGAPFAARDTVLRDQSLRDLIAQVEDTQRRYLTTHGTPKHKVRAELHALEIRLQRAMLHLRRQRVGAKLGNLQKLANSRDLFGAKVDLTAPQHDELRALTDALQAIDNADRALQAGRTSPLAFSYASRFGEMLVRDGFDLIITNPPWVRAQHIQGAHHDVLRTRYQCQHNRLWQGARAAGIRAPFGTQVDLANLFVERSLELLRPGGRLCGLVPAKLFNSLHGAALREQIARHTLVALEDYSDGTRQLFDATVYPAMLHVQKAATPRAPADTPRRPARPSLSRASVRMTVWRGDRARCWRTDPTDLYAQRGQPGAPWLLAEPRALRLFARMQQRSTPLGTIDALQPTRGVFTGANEVFLAENADFRALLGDDFARLSRPVLGGRDLRPWAVQTPRCILWPYDPALNPRSELPESLARYFYKHQKRLRKRSDHKPGAPLWQIFRVSAQIMAPKVVWRDISPTLEAALAPADVVPLNTVYFIALADVRRAAIVAALFNSAPMRAFAFALAERARGGWRRHFAWVIRLLPLPARIATFVQGGDDAELLGFAAEFSRAGDAAPSAALCRRFDEFAGACWGLSPDEIDYLRSWQCGEEAA